MSSLETSNRALAAAVIAPVVAAPFTRNLQAAKGVKTFTRTGVGNYSIELEDPAAFLEGLVLCQLPKNVIGYIGAQITPASAATYDPDLDVPKVTVSVLDGSGSPVDPQFFYFYVLKFNEGEYSQDAAFVVPTPAVDAFAGTTKFLQGFVVTADIGGAAAEVGNNPDGSNGGTALDSTGTTLLSAAAALALDLATVGAGGLDTGVIAASTLYNVFVIGGSTGPVAAIASLAASPLLPAGYTKFRRVGALLSDSGSNLVPMATLGSGNTRQVFYAAQQPVLVAGASTASDTVDVSDVVPVGAEAVSVSGQLTGTTAGTGDLDWYATTLPGRFAISATGQFQDQYIDLPLMPGSLDLNYRVSVATVNLSVQVRSWTLVF